MVYGGFQVIRCQDFDQLLELIARIRLLELAGQHRPHRSETPFPHFWRYRIQSLSGCTEHSPGHPPDCVPDASRPEIAVVPRKQLVPSILKKAHRHLQTRQFGYKEGPNL